MPVDYALIIVGLFFVIAVCASILTFFVFLAFGWGRN